MSRERKVKADNPALVTDPQDFREQTGVDYAVFLKAVKGKTGLTKNQWDIIAHYLGVSLDELLGKHVILQNPEKRRRQNKPGEIFAITVTAFTFLRLLVIFATWNVDFPFSIGKYLRDSTSLIFRVFCGVIFLFLA